MTALTPDLALKQEAAWLYKSVKASSPTKAQEAFLRVQTYVPRMIEANKGSRLQCPRCWINHGARASLTPIASDSDQYDVVRCDDCSVEIVLPI